jgi:hypothetical protein
MPSGQTNCRVFIGYVDAPNDLRPQIDKDALGHDRWNETAAQQSRHMVAAEIAAITWGKMETKGDPIDTITVLLERTRYRPSNMGADRTQFTLVRDADGRRPLVPRMIWNPVKECPQIM